jgi:FkbM family methyltransferase
MEFEEMMFLLHLLRENDLFVDAGANVGVYSLLASGLAKARSIAFEPVPKTFEKLKAHVALNKLSDRIECINKGLGEHEGTLCFSSGESDCLNHVLTTPSNADTSCVEVPVTTLDQTVHSAPTLIKMDIEGYEWFALRGADSLLKNPLVEALILEFNEHSKRYGITQLQLEELLASYGFHPYSYDPFRRTLSAGTLSSGGNTLLIKDVSKIHERVKSSPSYSIFGQMI